MASINKIDPLIIKSRIAMKEYRWRDMATILYAECSGVFFGDEKTEKLKMRSGGDWDMAIRKISSSCFDKREDFDRFVLNQGEKLLQEETVKEIFLENALQMIDLKIKVNKKFYRTHLDVLEKDLEADLDQQQLEVFLDQPGNDQELLYKILGRYVDKEIPEIDHSMETWEKHMMFYDLRIVQKDGNQAKATCRRGDDYYLLYYATS